MAEYWKSAPKFWCKQCKIYIRDTAFEKTQHEATAKHQSNLKRFLRDIHRENERSQRDSQRAKDEVERLRSSVAGGEGGNKDATSGSLWKKSAAAAPAPAPPRPVSVEERKKQMAQLAEMGVAIPDAYRGDFALAGGWETVSEKVVRPEGEEEKQATLGVRKRKADADLDEEEEEAKKEAEKFVSQGWGSRTKRYPGVKDDGDEDLDALFAATKEVKKKESGTAEDESAAPGEDVKTEDVKKEDALDAEAPAKEAESSGVVFKKRRPKAMKK
ncbi:putative formin binding protein [Aspergillus stella-maris]|uniref:putative formin binding protein n=1 Tax=Aspergillus stella-maris TaxID=1810926 RepID=UPI003CCCAF11